MLLDALFKSNETKALQFAKFLDNSVPVFSQFGRSIYASDIVQTCIDRIATECSKLTPLHIRRDENGLMQPVPKGDALNRLFKNGPNPMMSTHDFIEKMIWILYFNYNSFIYPQYEIFEDTRGNVSRIYTALWPLDPTQVDFLQDEAGSLFVQMFFRTGYSCTLPYSDLIHLRKKFSVNDVMGGGYNGEPDNAALLKTLEINDTVLQGVGKAVNTSLNARGILKINTLMDDKAQQAERKNFEDALTNGKSGILPVDLKGDFTPITIDPKIVDSTTLQFLESKVLRWYGVPLCILNADYNDDQYSAWFATTIAPIISGTGQAFTNGLFTPTELAFNNEIAFYGQNLELLSTQNKLAIIDHLGGRGALTNNFLLGLFGIPPYEGGDVRIADLNHINVNIMDAYQMAKATKGAAAPDEGGESNGSNTISKNTSK